MPPILRRASAILDIATGTRASSAEAALAGCRRRPYRAIVIYKAADISPAMAGKARERLGKVPNVSVTVEDGQALSFSDERFDAVLCNLGLIFFPDPVRGLSEFLRRVLRPGGHAAASVNTVVERFSYNHQINVMIARYVPSLAESVTRTFALRRELHELQLLFNEAGFADFETDTVKHTFVLPSFDAYYGPFERGGASTGQALSTSRGNTPRRTRRGAARPGRHWRAGQGGSGVPNCQRPALRAQ